MANRHHYPKRAFGTSRVDLEFIFTGPGAGTSVASSAIDGANAVASITHTGGTNILTVTLQDAFLKVIDATANIIGTAGAWASIGSISNEGTSTPLSFNIYTWVAAGTANNDVALPITVKLSLKNSSWGTK